MRVLLATDGSRDARAAATVMRDFPLPDDARMLVVTAVHAPAAHLGVPTAPKLRAALRAEGQRTLDEARSVLGPRGATAELRVLEGNPRTEILAAADEWKADLIVLGARGLGGVGGLLLGSVSSSVAHHASCAVLVAKGRPRKIETVMVALDGSAAARAGARFLRGLPLGPAIRVRLIGVVEQTHFPSTAPRLVRARLRTLVSTLERERRAALDRELAEAAAELRSGVARVTRGTVTGNAAVEIIRAAGEVGADLVVVGSRGLGGVERLLLGSVSERVLHNLRCSVLIVKRPAPGATPR